MTSMPSKPVAPRIAAVAATLALALAGAGCGEAGSTAGASSGKPPSLYLDQTLQLLEQGRNTQLEGYRERLAACQEAGIASRPLSPADEPRVGTQRWQMWRDQDRYAYRMETWRVAQPANARSREDLCVFTLAVEGLHGYVDAERSTTVDLATGERTDGEGNPGIVLAAGNASRGGSSTPDSVAGQPCNRVQAADGSSACVWSGGTGWGFADAIEGGFDATAGMHLDTIVLEATPAPGSTGYELRTSTFVVGAPLDQDQLQPGN